MNFLTICGIIFLSLLGILLSFIVRNLLIPMDNPFKTQFAFYNKKIEIPEEDIMKKFLDTTILLHLEKAEKRCTLLSIYDISLYEKNQVIGLTYFVPGHILDHLKKRLMSAEMIGKVKEELLRTCMEDGLEIDINELDDVIKKTIAQKMSYDMYIQHCTVYQLKNGEWVWRYEG